MKKLIYSVLGICLALGMASCNKNDEPAYTQTIEIYATIQIENQEVVTYGDEDLTVLNEINDWIDGDLKTLVFAYAATHLYSYKVSGDKLEDLYKQAEEKYEAEQLQKDIEDAKSHFSTMQKALNDKNFEKADVTIPVTFKAKRVQGNADGASIYTEDLGSITLTAMPE